MVDLFSFTDKNGEEKTGTMIRPYKAFEGGVRYIVIDSNGKEYRCVEDKDGKLIEYVV